MLRSLRARTIVLVLLAVVIAQVATFAVFTLYRRNIADNWSGDVLIPIIRMAKNAVQSLSAAELENFIRENAADNWRLEPESKIVLPPFGVRRDGTPSLSPEGPPILRRLNRRLAGEAQVYFAFQPQPAFWVRLTDKEKIWWLIVPVERLRPPLPLSSIAAMVLVFVGILAVAGLYAVQVTRPLRKLADATESVAQGKMVNVDVSGPLEIRTLAQRFNAMTMALDEAQKTQRTLLAGLPHDLKGPLSRMRLRAEMADDAELARGLLQDTHEMQAIIDQFLVYLRGNEASSYSMQTVVLSQWLEQRVAHYSQSGQPVHLLKADSCYVQADTLMLTRMLDNLIDNALNHGMPPIEVSLTVHNKVALLKVRDHGAGITPHLRETALQPFSRLDQARTQTGSVGLGLAIAQRVAKLHGGELLLQDPETGPGITVVLQLPLA